MSSRAAAHRNSSYCTLLIVIIEFAYIVIEQVALCTFCRMICSLPPCVKINLHIFYLCNLHLRQHCVIDLYQFGINAQITIVLLITKANFHHFLPIYYTMICF